MPEIDEVKHFANGKIGRWDGHGWVDVTATRPVDAVSRFQQLRDEIFSTDLASALKHYLTADARLETSAENVTLASNLLALANAEHQTARLPAETAAVIAAHGAAARAGIHPAIFHSQEYQMGKLNATLASEMRLTEVHLEHLKDKLAYELDLKSARDLDSRTITRVLDLRERILDSRDLIERLKNSGEPEAVLRDKLRVARKTLAKLEADLDALVREAKQSR